MTHYEIFKILEKEGKLKALLKNGIIPIFWNRYKNIYEDYLNEIENDKEEKRKHEKCVTYQYLSEKYSVSLMSIIRAIKAMKNKFNI